MYVKLVYIKDGVEIAEVFKQFNGHIINGDAEALWDELKQKIKAKENGNNRWDWKEGLRQAFYDSFPMVPRPKERS